MHRLLTILTVLGATLSLVAEDFQHPVLRVPQMAAAPTLDGMIDPAEWAEATEFTGFSGNPLGKPFLLPEAQQPVWYIGWHGQTIYIAMQSPHPKGTYPTGRVKEDDIPDTLFGDHTEIQLCTVAREDAGKPFKGFYKLVTNAWGANWDSHYYNGTPGTEDLWNCGGDVACHVTDSMWQMELAVDAERIKLPTKLDGRHVVVQLVRAADTGGIYYAGWVGKSWMAWQDFAEVDFDADAPAVRFAKLGEIMAGTVDATVEVRGMGKGPQQVDVSMLVENASGKAIWQQQATVIAAPGEVAEARFQARDLPVDEVDIEGKRNHFEIKAEWVDGKRRTVLYHNRSPFMKLNAAWQATYWDPWVAARPQSGRWESKIAYLPYSNHAQASVDVDFFGMPAAVRTAGAYTVAVRAKDQAEVLAKTEGQLVGGAGEAFFAVPDLPDGDYEAVFTIYDQAGGRQVGQQIESFVRRHYAWEHNALGKSNEVIPPFLPLAVNPDRPILTGGGAGGRTYIGKQAGDTIWAWGRMLRVGDLALPEQIVVTPPTGTCGRPESLLAAPIQLELRAGGGVVPFTDAGHEIVGAAEHRVDVVGGGQAGNVRVDVQAHEEYDGWYEVAVTLTPQGATTIEGLDLVADLDQKDVSRYQPAFPVDTMYVHRMGGGLDNSVKDALPTKPGVVYRSTELWPAGGRSGPADMVKDWKSFVPITYVGNGDRGLWFFAWSSIGWELRDDVAMLEIERLEGGDVRLRVRLIAGDTRLDRPRTLRFALQAAPFKANDSEYRTRIDEIAHDTSGYRYYGDSVDAFSLHADEDYAALRKYLLYGTKDQPDDQGGRYNHWAGRLGKMISSGEATRIMLYGSQWMTGLGDPAFDTYGGEWLGNSNWKPVPDLKFMEKWNYGHTVRWDTPRKVTASRVNWPASMVDFFVWYHDQLIDKVGINGTWWDNCYSGTVTEYDPELGAMDAKWNIPMRRELCKRLNVVGWQHQRPPCWSMNTQVEMSWCQVFWMVEGIWGPSSKDISTIDHFGSVDTFRAATRTKSTTMIPKTSYMTHYRGSTPEKDRKMTRSSDGILLLHDIAPAFDKGLVGKLNAAVDWADPAACLFMGYWGVGPFVRTPQEKIAASFYQNAARRTAVIVFFNADKKDHYLGGTRLDPAGVCATPTMVPAEADRALAVNRVYDLETGAPVKVVFRDGMLEIADPCVVGSHEYRLLALEAE